MWSRFVFIFLHWGGTVSGWICSAHARITVGLLYPKVKGIDDIYFGDSQKYKIRPVFFSFSRGFMRRQGAGSVWWTSGSQKRIILGRFLLAGIAIMKVTVRFKRLAKFYFFSICKWKISLNLKKMVIHLFFFLLREKMEMLLKNNDTKYED